MPVMATEELEAKRIKLIREMNRAGDVYDSVQWSGLGSSFFAKRAYRKAKKAMAAFYAEHNISRSNRK